MTSHCTVIKQDWLRIRCRLWPTYKSLGSGVLRDRTQGSSLPLAPGQRSRACGSSFPSPTGLSSSVLPHLIFNSCLASGGERILRPCSLAEKTGYLAPQAPHSLEAGAGIPCPSLFLFTAPASCLILLKLRQRIRTLWGAASGCAGAQNCPCNQATLITFKLV